MTNEEEREKHYKELIRLSIIAGLKGEGANVGKYYVSFSFRKRKDICKECGKQID